MTSNWNNLATDEVLTTTVKSLKANGITTFVVDNGRQAADKVFELIPKKSQVMTMTSVTLNTIGLTKTLNEFPDYVSVKNLLSSADSPLEKQQLGAAPDWTVGSVHAVTSTGQLVIASMTGSQLPAYAYGSPHVIFVVGIQKIVNNLDDAFNRIYQYVLPLESDRAHRAYGVPGSAVNKLLIINQEVNPSRLTLIFVKESLGF